MKKTMMMLLMAVLCLATVSGCTKKQSYEPDRKETVNDSQKEKQGSQKADTANDEKEDVEGSDSTDADSGRKEESTSEEPEYARLTYDGETLSATVDAIYIDNDGNLAVQVKGMGGVFGGVLPIRNNQFIIPVCADVRIGETTHSWKSATTEIGKLTYHYELKELPDEVVLYTVDNKEEKHGFEAGPYITEAPAPDAESEEASTEEALPEELIGVWTGKGEPEGGGDPIDLEITVNSDATGEYQFEQAGYKESYPFTLESEANSFRVNIPADNQLGISSCKGTYSYDDGKLTLHIKTEFSTGRNFEYTAVCAKKE